MLSMLDYICVRSSSQFTLNIHITDRGINAGRIFCIHDQRILCTFHYLYKFCSQQSLTNSETRKSDMVGGTRIPSSHNHCYHGDMAHCSMSGTLIEICAVFLFVTCILKVQAIIEAHTSNIRFQEPLCLDHSLFSLALIEVITCANILTP